MKKQIFTIALFSLLLPNLLAQTVLKDNLNTAGNSLAEANNRFAISLWQKAKKDSTNLFISPLSMHVALNMVYPSAAGNTQAEMTKVLGYSSNTVNLKDYTSFAHAFNPQNDSSFQQILRAAKQQNEEGAAWGVRQELPQLRMDLCNSLWYKQADYWYKDYFERIKQAFQAQIFEFNENNLPEINLKANQWVREKTNGRITELPTKFDGNTELILLNAVYFSADWAKSFEEKETKKRAFRGINKVKTKIDCMKRRGQILYYEDTDIQAVELNYFSGLYSFVVLLPTKKYGINDLENKLNTAYYDRIIKGLKHEDVVLTLPKFRIESEISIVDNLKALGMSEAFSDKANFPELASKPMKISKVLHKTFIETSEKKTEAAAITLVEMTLRGGIFRDMPPPPPPQIVNSDHPFLFLIKHNPTNTIAFMGRYVKP